MACPNAIFGLNTAILEAVVQIPGTALRLDRKLFLSEIDRSDEARALMQRYMRFAISELAQTAASTAYIRWRNAAAAGS